MGIDILKEIAFDDMGGGCAEIRTPDGIERNIGFQGFIPVDQKRVMLIQEIETRRGSKRIPWLVEVGDDLAAYRIANNFPPTADNRVVTFLPDIIDNF